MGTVHSFQAAALSPERLRQRFDHAVPSSEKAENDSHPLPEVLVSGGIFFLPLALAGQIADNAFRDASLFWLSCTREQLRFLCFIP